MYLITYNDGRAGLSTTPAARGEWNVVSVVWVDPAYLEGGK